MQARTLEVLTVLSTGRVILARDLAARFGTSERTIRRDISQLRDEGYRIDSAPGIGGGYRALSGAVLAPLQFSANEVFTLAMALRAFGGQGMRDAEAATHREHVHHIENTMHKLRSVLPSDIAAELESASNAIVSAPGNEPEVPFDILVILASAVAKSRMVDLEYSGGTHDSQRRVEPYRIVVFGAHWYLFAWDLLRGDWRTFRLDRIAAVHATTFGFEHRPSPDAVVFVRDSVSQSVYQTTVRVRMHASASEVSPQVPARAGQVTPVSSDECELVIGADTTAWIVALLLHLGHQFTVVEPASFRAEMAKFHDHLGSVLERTHHDVRGEEGTVPEDGTESLRR